MYGPPIAYREILGQILWQIQHQRMMVDNNLWKIEYKKMYNAVKQALQQKETSLKQSISAKRSIEIADPEQWKSTLHAYSLKMQRADVEAEERWYDTSPTSNRAEVWISEQMVNTLAALKHPGTIRLQ